MNSDGIEKRTHGAGKEKIQELSNGERLWHQGNSLSASGPWMTGETERETQPRSILSASHMSVATARLRPHTSAMGEPWKHFRLP